MGDFFQNIFFKNTSRGVFVCVFKSIKWFAECVIILLGSGLNPSLGGDNHYSPIVSTIYSSHNFTSLNPCDAMNLMYSVSNVRLLFFVNH
jgi:hypothetical protein